MASAALLAVVLTGCVSLVDPLPRTKAPAPAWSNAPEEARLARAEIARWWHGFNDDELSQLIEEAIAENIELRIATARVREARAAATVVASTLWPTLNLDGFAGRNKDLDRLPLKPPIGNVATIGLSAQWELDLFGGNRAAVAVAERQALAAAELRNAVQVMVASEVGSTLFAQRGVAARLQTLERSMLVANEALRLARERYARGLATDFDVDRALAQLKTVESQLPTLHGQLKELSHRLAVLRGGVPRGDAASTVLLPEALPGLPGLLPSDWLEARPDLKAAKRQVEAANFALADTRSDLFPKFVLSATAGRTRVALQGRPSLIDNVFSLGVGLLQPIFNAGRVRAQIEGADARLAEAAAAYDRSLLTAIEEVENAYVAFNTAGAQQSELRLARDAALRAQNKASALYQRGLVDYGIFLDAQRAALAADDSLIQATTRRVVALVSLYRAFGGGIPADPHGSQISARQGD